MSDDKNEVQDESAHAPIVYASPMKRIWAWVGVVYMVIIVLLITYMFSFSKYLQGIGALMVCPAIAGVGASLICAWKTGTRKSNGRLALLVILLVLCGVLLFFSLGLGVNALIANFGA